jgi:hypothetical protein
VFYCIVSKILNEIEYNISIIGSCKKYVKLGYKCISKYSGNISILFIVKICQCHKITEQFIITHFKY